MSNIKLLPHNEEAYQRLINCLEFNQMVAINHATGTGKSFIILKYLYENKNKKILYFAPTYQIIDQLIENHTKELGINVGEFENFDTLIYANLLGKDVKSLASEYDIIILDEYHRCGAKKWGEKINEILTEIKTNYPDKKVIGTTATEIRFLDNERNMNNILFDGVCASRLTLADAILKGILPVPVYINAVYEIYEILETIEKKVKSKCFYKININKYLTVITSLRQELEKSMSSLGVIDKTFKKGGKYLVFSSTIDKINKDKETIKKLFKNKIASDFEVHSKKGKLKNKEVLEEFKNTSKGNNFLYSINLLNEGLHVKDIDSIFMFRRTTSPIIYFQQLGRLLSYSKRRDVVYVFDLVNNIKNHPYIYYLYQEVYRKAHELMELEPDKKDFYQNIINNFKVINLTSNLCEKIDILSNEVKTNNLKKERLNTAVLILEGKIKTTLAEKVQAQIDIFKLKNFIDIDLFKRIKELDIRKPKIFNLDEKDYNRYLNDEKFRDKFDQENKDDNLTQINNEIIFRKEFEDVLVEVEIEFEKEKNKETYYKKIYLDILEFIKEKHRSPKYSQTTNYTQEIKLFFKKIIFYNELDKRGYIEKLNKDEIRINKEYILKEYVEFSIKHDGDLPSLKVDDDKEKKLVKMLKQIEPLFEQSEISIINNLRKNQLTKLKQVIKEYLEFIKIHKRYPLEDSKDEKERSLFNSYLRCEEFLTKEEKGLIKNTVLAINKKTVLQNTYMEMMKNRK